MATFEDITGFLLENCKPNEIEIEARFNKEIISPISIKHLLNYDNIKWNKYTHIERRLPSQKNKNSTYRQRDNNIICKSFIHKENFTDLWFILYINIEKPISSMKNRLSRIDPIVITRYRGEFNEHYIDITYDNINNNPRLEVEIIDVTKFNINNTIHTIKEVCKILQNSKYFLGYYMSKTINVLERTLIDGKYQKPKTMIIQDLYDIQQHTNNWVVTAKVDGTRRFIIIYNDTVYSSDIQGFIKIEYILDRKFNNPVILDAEYIESENIFYIFDLIMYNGIYYSKSKFFSRIKLLDKVDISNIPNFVLKEYFQFDSFNSLTKIYNYIKRKYSIDGLIFLNVNKPYLQKVQKWKMNCTVDLQIVTNNNTRTLITNDDITINIPWDDKNPDAIGIWEFQYKDSKLIPIKSRSDKPQANSKQIIITNLFYSVPGTIFDGTGCYLMRKYHNMVKLTMLKQSNLKNSILVDIGTGQGGDYNKWLTLKTIYCIEPSKNAIADFTKRIKPNDTRIKILNNPIKNININDILSKVNIFTAFFCTNLFTEDDWNKFIELIKNKSSTKCKILIIALTNPTTGNNNVFKLDMIDTKTYNISLHNTRIVNITEFVVDIELLSTKMKLCGFNKTLEEKLNKNTFMSTNELKLSSMYTKMIFKNF